MTSEITSSLLTQAKEQLGSGDFEMAADSARSLLSLNDLNSEASGILLEAEAATRILSQLINETEQNSLKLISSEIQLALNNKKMNYAEGLVNKFLEKHPDNQNAVQILTKIRLAHEQHDIAVKRSKSKRARLAEIERLDANSAKVRAALNKSGYLGGEAGTRRGLPSEKPFDMTLVLCIFLGIVGGHRFYVGKNGTGILMLISLGLFGIWTLVDLVQIAKGNFTDGLGGEIKP
jgi:hypothetical protein